jgi:hypothetical protein
LKGWDIFFQSNSILAREKVDAKITKALNPDKVQIYPNQKKIGHVEKSQVFYLKERQNDFYFVHNGLPLSFIIFSIRLLNDMQALTTSVGSTLAQWRLMEATSHDSIKALKASISRH